MMHYMKKSWVVGPLSETHSPMKFSVGKAKYSLIIASIIVMTTLFWIHNVPKLVGHTDNSSNGISSPISASSLPFTTNFFSSSSSKNYFLSPSSAPIASSSSSFSFSSSSSPPIFSPSSSSSSSPSSSSSSSSSSSFSPSTSDIPTVSSSRIPPQEEWQVQHNRDELAQIALTTRLLKSPDTSVRSNLTTPKLTIIISSSPRNFEERHVIRQTWGGWLKEHGQQVFFIIGVPKSSLINGINMQSIDQESATYRDLIQYDFVDSYQNLTLKTVFTVRFFNEEILNLRKPAESWKSSPINLIHPQLKSTSNEPRYMMKADDDIVINPANLLRWIEFLAKLENHSDRGIIMGKLYKTNKPVRDPNHKYYMPREVYPLDVFPHFVQGSGYLFSRNVARSLWITLTHLKRCFYFASEDNFLTGMCAPKAVKMINDYVYNEDERMQIDILHNPEFKFVKFFENPGINPDFCSYISPFLTVFGHGLRPSQLIEIWQKMNSPQETFERCIKNIDMNSQYEAYKLLS